MSRRDDEYEREDEERGSPEHSADDPEYLPPQDPPEGLPSHVPDDWLDQKPFDPAGR